MVPVHSLRRACLMAAITPVVIALRPVHMWHDMSRIFVSTSVRCYYITFNFKFCAQKRRQTKAARTQNHSNMACTLLLQKYVRPAQVASLSLSVSEWSLRCASVEALGAVGRSRARFDCKGQVQKPMRKGRLCKSTATAPLSQETTDSEDSKLEVELERLPLWISCNSVHA